MNLNLLRMTAPCGALILIVSFVGTQRFQLQTKPASDLNAFSKEEQELLDEINLARTHPQEYADFVDSYYKNKKTKEGPSAVADLVRTLKSAKPLPPLQSEPGLRLAAHDLVEAQGAAGATGHDISSVEERASRYGTASDPLGENLSYGPLTPRERVMRTLLDDGIPSRIHRTNLLREAYKDVGISCGPHKEFGSMCATIMAGGFTPKPTP